MNIARFIAVALWAAVVVIAIGAICQVRQLEELTLGVAVEWETVLLTVVDDVAVCALLLAASGLLFVLADLAGSWKEMAERQRQRRR